MSCAATRRARDEETWITQDMLQAYTQLHRKRYAHSVECWHGDSLVGGLYGIALGSVFFGESMFSAYPNSSKLALIYLVNFLKLNGYRLIDCQMTTDHLVSLGAREITGKKFQDLLKTYIHSNNYNGAWPHEESG
jgi:leucyl/phenylalanyl-tRNA--protein transferase